MTTPDLFQTVGFEKSKIGSNETELGYAIRRTRLIGLIVATLGCMSILAVLGVWSQFEIHFEKRSYHKALRKEEHRAVSKLAEVGMQLWGEYRDDIKESKQAQALMKNLNMSNMAFKARMRKAIEDSSKELNLNGDKAKKLVDNILDLVADHQHSNLQNTKGLVDHLVEAGKRAAPLEKRAEHEVMKEVQEEQKAIKEDIEAGEALPEPVPVEAEAGKNASEPADPLKGILEGFFFIFNDYEREFGGKPRQLMKPGNPAYDGLKKLSEEMDDMSDADLAKKLDTIDLDAVGAGLGSGRILPAADIVEELLMIGDIPHRKLKALEEEWRAGTQDSVSVFGIISKLHEEHQVPTGWLQRGVDEDEKEETLREEEEEKEMLNAEAEAEEKAALD